MRAWRLQKRKSSRYQKVLRNFTVAYTTGTGNLGTIDIYKQNL